MTLIIEDFAFEDPLEQVNRYLVHGSGMTQCQERMAKTIGSAIGDSMAICAIEDIRPSGVELSE